MMLSIILFYQIIQVFALGRERPVLQGYVSAIHIMMIGHAACYCFSAIVIS